MWFEIAKLYSFFYRIVQDRFGINIRGIGWLMRKISSDHVLLVDDVKIFFDHTVANCYLRLISGSYNEPETHIFIKAVVSELSSKINFVDVGANIGEMITDFARLPQIEKVFAFEPNPRCVAVCKENIRLNNYTNITLIPKVVNDDGRDVLFHINEEAAVTSSIAEQSSSHSPRRKRFAATTLDTELRSISFSTILLIDVEGAEALVMKGGREFIRANMPLIIFEYHEVTRTHFSLDDVRAILGSQYHIYRLRQDGMIDDRLDDTWNCVAVNDQSLFFDACMKNFKSRRDSFGEKQMSEISQTPSIVIGLPVLLYGGTEQHTLNITKILHDAGYSVTVLCYYEYDENVVVLFRNAGAQVRLMELHRDMKHTATIFQLYSLLQKLIKEFRVLNPSIIHIQYVAPGLVPILAARLATRSFITTAIHTSGSYFYGWKSKLLFWFASTLCDSVVCVSNDVRQFWFGEKSRRKVKVIYNAVDEREISSIVNSSKGIPSGNNRLNIREKFHLTEKHLFIIIGRAGKHKGHDIAFRAFAKIVAEFPSAQLVLIGDIIEETFLRQLAEDLHIKNKIVWLGALPRTRTVEILFASDCLLVPSRYEGFGLTAIEAMAVGVPVIAHAVGGLKEIIVNEKNGLFFNNENVEQLAEAMHRIITEEKLRQQCIEGGKESVRTQFSFERFTASIKALYNGH